MATITGVNIYIDGVKHNTTPQPLTQATYDISNVKAEGAAFNVQFSYTYDDATESQLTAIQSYSLAVTEIPVYTPDAETSSYMNQIAVVNDATVYNDSSEEQKTGEQTWYYYDKFIKKGKADGWYATGKMFLAEIGASFDAHKINAINPAATVFPTYANSWVHGNNKSLPLNKDSNIEIPTTYEALGVGGNDITVGAVELSNGKASSVTDKFLFGNVDGATSRVALLTGRNNARVGLTIDTVDYTHNDLNSSGAIIATIQSDNIQRTYKKGVKIGETASQNGTLPTGNIHLHSLNNFADLFSPQSASMYWIGTGVTDAQGISLSNALQTLATDLNLINDMTPAPVLYSGDTSKGSFYWTKVMKSSDYPEFTITKPYWVLYSTDHATTGNDGVFWGEMDDLDFNGFVEGGLIVSGNQSETPWLIRTPSGKAGDTFKLYFQRLGGIGQETRLITSNGGAAPHLSTWTLKVNRPIQVQSGDNHTGYVRVYDRGTDLIATHLAKSTVPIIGRTSISTDGGLNFTNLAVYDGTATNMPTGKKYIQETMYPFTYNATLYAITIIKNISDSANRRLGLITLNSNYLANTFVKYISGEIPQEKITGNEVEAGSNIIHFTSKYAGAEFRQNPIFSFKVDITKIMI